MCQKTFLTQWKNFPLPPRSQCKWLGSIKPRCQLFDVRTGKTVVIVMVGKSVMSFAVVIEDLNKGLLHLATWWFPTASFPALDPNNLCLRATVAIGFAWSRAALLPHSAHHHAVSWVVIPREPSVQRRKCVLLKVACRRQTGAGDAGNSRTSPRLIGVNKRGTAHFLGQSHHTCCLTLTGFLVDERSK